jgi:hypothetical protein
MGQGLQHRLKNSTTRCRLALLVVVPCFVVGSGCFHPAQALGQTRIEKLKAVYLFNFGNYIDWPAAVVPAGTPPPPFVVGIVGQTHPIQLVINRIGSKKMIKGRRIKSIMIGDIAAERKCHVIFIPKDTPAKVVGQIVARTRNRPVLVVGEMNGFVAADGPGMINFRLVEKQLKFDLNQRILNKAGLKASSKLISLANLLIK